MVKMVSFMLYVFYHNKRKKNPDPSVTLFPYIPSCGTNCIWSLNGPPSRMRHTNAKYLYVVVNIQKRDNSWSTVLLLMLQFSEFIHIISWVLDPFTFNFN